MGLNSVSTVFADHGGSVPDCASATELYDPNSGQCIPEDQCPNGIYGLLLLSTVGTPHCFLVPMMAVGGEFIPIDTTMILVAGTQTTAAWMIPAIVSAIGIGIVIARKF